MDSQLIFFPNNKDVPEADLCLDFIIRWANMTKEKTGDREVFQMHKSHDYFVVMNERELCSTFTGQDASIIQRLCRRYILDGICRSPKVGNIWVDLGCQGETPLVFTIKTQADRGSHIPRTYVSEDWQHVPAMTTQWLEKRNEGRKLEDYQRTLSALLDSGDRRRAEAKREDKRLHLVAQLDNRMKLLEQEGGNVNRLPHDWKESPSEILYTLLKETERPYRSLLLHKIEDFGVMADPNTPINRLEEIVNQLRS
ncbi:hypothetical protein BDW68DRAFT_166974 [Aspergillus falconensis]